TSLVVLAHLLLARQDDLQLARIDVVRAGAHPTEFLDVDTSVLSTYPEIYSPLPFVLENEDPESGAYTLTAVLREPLEPESELRLNEDLAAWTRAVLAGAYA